MFKMSKLHRLGAILLMVGCVGVAWGATRIPSFVFETSFEDCFGAGPVDINMNPGADAMAIVNYVPGTDTTVVQVIVSDFGGTPVGTCIVRLNPDVGDLGTFRADSQGNGHFHGSVAGDHRGSNVELWQQADPPFEPHNCPAILLASGQ